MRDRSQLVRFASADDALTALGDEIDDYPEICARHCWMEDGVIYSLVWNNTFGEYFPPFFCGYVRLPLDYKWILSEDDILNSLPVHGGVTYAELEDDSIVIGFDCGHLADDRNPKLQDPEYLANELRGLVKAVRAAHNASRAIKANSTPPQLPPTV